MNSDREVRGASGLSIKFLNLLVVSLHFVSGIGLGELPVDGLFLEVPFISPGQDFSAQSIGIRDAAIQTLLRESRKFDFRHIEPGPFFRRVVRLKLLG